MKRKQTAKPPKVTTEEWEHWSNHVLYGGLNGMLGFPPDPKRIAMALEITYAASFELGYRAGRRSRGA